jgi:hypothetical protein
MSIKESVELYVKTHNYREESYIVPEELVSYLQSIYLVLLFSLILQQHWLFPFTNQEHLKEKQSRREHVRGSVNIDPLGHQRSHADLA